MWRERIPVTGGGGLHPWIQPPVLIKCQHQITPGLNRPRYDPSRDQGVRNIEEPKVLQREIHLVHLFT